MFLVPIIRGGGGGLGLEWMNIMATAIIAISTSLSHDCYNCRWSKSSCLFGVILTHARRLSPYFLRNAGQTRAKASRHVMPSWKILMPRSRLPSSFRIGWLVLKSRMRQNRIFVGVSSPITDGRNVWQVEKRRVKKLMTEITTKIKLDWQCFYRY